LDSIRILDSVARARWQSIEAKLRVLVEIACNYSALRLKVAVTANTPFCRSQSLCPAEQPAVGFWLYFHQVAAFKAFPGGMADSETGCQLASAWQAAHLRMGGKRAKDG
jgi:hypothetical protein